VMRKWHGSEKVYTLGDDFIFKFYLEELGENSFKLKINTFLTKGWFTKHYAQFEEEFSSNKNNPTKDAKNMLSAYIKDITGKDLS